MKIHSCVAGLWVCEQIFLQWIQLGLCSMCDAEWFYLPWGWLVAGLGIVGGWLCCSHVSLLVSFIFFSSACLAIFFSIPYLWFDDEWGMGIRWFLEGWEENVSLSTSIIFHFTDKYVACWYSIWSVYWCFGRMGSGSTWVCQELKGSQEEAGVRGRPPPEVDIAI